MLAGTLAESQDLKPNERPGPGTDLPSAQETSAPTGGVSPRQIPNNPERSDQDEFCPGAKTAGNENANESLEAVGGNIDSMYVDQGGNSTESDFLFPQMFSCFLWILAGTLCQPHGTGHDYNGDNLEEFEDHVSTSDEGGTSVPTSRTAPMRMRR
ncbi:hypothetical protein M413DRAFT_14661 [Hebeloma cylindrosporum]|uniref:Uncharacterized protein n=1 Tax=Hebeloma cylindrosporum TaxID=76867 RepID=A0A0C3BEP1_HEBCY|nr:hypothetical protein M413DRAFT_14661 [Hebeloma cylindrosporum h7]